MRSHPLPGNAQHQGLELLGIELKVRLLACSRPDKASPVEPAQRYPDIHTIMHQDLHARGAPVRGTYSEDPL